MGACCDSNNQDFEPRKQKRSKAIYEPVELEVLNQLPKKNCFNEADELSVRQTSFSEVFPKGFLS